MYWCMSCNKSLHDIFAKEATIWFYVGGGGGGKNFGHDFHVTNMFLGVAERQFFIIQDNGKT